MFTIFSAHPRNLDTPSALLDGYGAFYQQDSNESACRTFLSERLKRSASYLLSHDTHKTSNGFDTRLLHLHRLDTHP